MNHNTPQPVARGKVFAVAPMMDWTDRHCRAFHRGLSRAAVLYTEMVTALAVINGNRQKLLGYNAVEHPVVLQLGGSDPALLAEACRVGEGFGYDAINLNCGCPSDRVQGGHFGACLMAEPALVARCFVAMQEAVNIPVTIKCRIGIDDMDEFQGLQDFVTAVAAAGCRHYVLHARKAWLKGLSPKENREIPPLNYDRIHDLKLSFPNLNIVLNGGMSRLKEDLNHLLDLDGLMYGREAYHNPWMLTDVDPLFAGQAAPVQSRREAVENMRPYIEAQLSIGVPLHRITRHMLGLYHGQPGGRIWRQILSVEGCKPDADIKVLEMALQAVDHHASRHAAAA